MDKTNTTHLDTISLRDHSQVWRNACISRTKIFSVKCKKQINHQVMITKRVMMYTLLLVGSCYFMNVRHKTFIQ